MLPRFVEVWLTRRQRCLGTSGSSANRGFRRCICIEFGGKLRGGLPAASQLRYMREFMCNQPIAGRVPGAKRRGAK